MKPFVPSRFYKATHTSSYVSTERAFVLNMTRLVTVLVAISVLISCLATQGKYNYASWRDCSGIC